MKKAICIIVALSIIVAGCVSCAPAKEKTEKYLIVASFYPVYIFTLNIVDGIEDFSVESMAQQNVGCLHDYSLTARDVKLLQDASVFVMNGAGMELFIEDIYESVENLRIIDSSTGIEPLCSGNHGNEDGGEHHSHNHHENSHIWLSVENAKKQIENIKNGLVERFPQYEEEMNANCLSYIERLTRLEKKRDEYFSDLSGAKVIAFHGGYEYLSGECGFEIVETIESDEGAEPSANALGELSRRINDEEITALFTEPDYSGSAADILSAETGIRVFRLDPVVSGEARSSAYEEIMEENYKVILRAVK